MNLNEVSVDDLKVMFQSSVVRYGGVPVYVSHISPEKTAFFTVIGNASEKVAKLDDPLWDMRPINTGYVNVLGFSPFIYRLPKRQFKQGLCHDNAVTRYNMPYGDDRQSAAIDKANSLICSPIHNMACNIYPSLHQAIEMFEDANVEVAFDRQFCVNSYGHLYYKARRVGDVCLNTAKITFAKQFEFLKAAL